MKKISAIILALVMVLALAVPAMAATTYTLTINNTAPGHTYDAYQIFSGTLSSDGSTLSDIEWGAGIANPAGFVAALLADEVSIPLTGGATTTLKTVFSAVADVPAADQAAKVAEIAGTISNDSFTLDRFAELLGTFTAGAHLYLGTPTATTNTHVDGTHYDISGLPAGYYLVKDRDGTQEGEADFYSKYMVQIVKDGTVNVKGGNVTVDKGVNDTLDGTYDNVEDFDVNDTAYYKWTGTLPTNLRAYTEYWYKFTDTLPAGLTFVQLEQVYIEGHDGTPSHVFLDIHDAIPENDTLPTGITFNKVDNGDGTSVLTLEFNDLLKLYPSLLSTDKVVVKYSTYVNRDALIEKANTNEVYLEYDNNPNGEGHGKTVPDVAHAFTFHIEIDKYDMADPTKKLEGVEFVLYYRTVDAMENIVPMYAKVVTEEMIAAAEVINGKAVDADDLGLVYGWTANRAEASILDTDANGAINIKGLDEGTYFLEETKTVEGYNKLDTPVQIDIIPTYTETGDECSVTVEYKVDSISQGASHVVGVRNSKGSTLPSTGGMGTTVFYIIGSVMLLGAVVLLVTRKRMAI